MSCEKIKIVILVLLAVAGCKTSFDDPKYSAGEADFSRYVAVGGDYTAGFADNALYLESQQNSFPNILSSRFALARQQIALRSRRCQFFDVRFGLLFNLFQLRF